MVTKLYSYELKTSWQKRPTRKGLLLQWNDGWGEIAPLPGWSSETLDEAKDEILSLLPNLDSAKPRLPSVQFGIEAASKPLDLKPLARVILSATEASCWLLTVEGQFMEVSVR